MTAKHEDQIIELIESRGLAETTQISYLSKMRKFTKYHGNKSPEELDLDDIKSYQKHLIKSGKISPSSINNAMSALKFYYVQILERYDYDRKVPWMKTKKPIPVILSEEEISRVLDSSNNILWKAVLMVTYSAGLRNSEVRNLKITDVDSKRMVLYIRDSKYGISREALLSPITLACLRQYWKARRQNKIKSDYLFMPVKYNYDGKIKKKLSHTALSYMIKRSAKLAGVKKKFTLIVCGTVLEPIL